MRPLKYSEWQSVDTETTGLNRWTGARPFMVQICRSSGEEILFEWPVDPNTREVIIPRKELRELMGELSGRCNLFFNAKFDLFMLEAIGVKLPMRDKRGKRLVEEVNWMARMVNNLEFSHELKPLAKKYLKITDEDAKELQRMVVASRAIGKRLGWSLGDNVKSDYWMPAAVCMHQPEVAFEKGISADAARDYGMMDVRRTLELGEMYAEGMNEYGLWEAYDREMSLLPVTMQMEREGVTVDKKRMARVRSECLKMADEALKYLRKRTKNKDFNPNSHAHVSKMLYGGGPRKLKPMKRTAKSGAPSTDAEALEAYMAEPEVRALLTNKACTKAINTFFDKYEALMTDDGKVHPGYKQIGTLTFRYACVEPNMQQVSSPESSNSRAREFLVDIRQVFIPDPGHVWLAPDYKQMEVIIFAAVYGVETMLQAIREGRHIHKATADKIYGGEGNPLAVQAATDVIKSTKVEGDWTDAARSGRGLETAALKLLEQHKWSIISLEEALGEESYKKRAKSATFTKIFGGGWRALMGWLPGISEMDARATLRSFDNAFPDMAEAMAEIENRGRKDGYVMTPYGRRLQVDRFASYRIINHVVQSSAADQMKLGMLKCAKYLEETGLRARIAMTVHDELIFQFWREHLYKKVIRKLSMLMGDHEGRLSVDLPVDVDIIKERWSMKESLSL